MHVITECTLIDFTPAVSISSHIFSSIIFFFDKITSPVIGCFISSAAVLPSTLSDKLTIMFPPSIISESVIESLDLHPQSCCVTRDI